MGWTFRRDLPRPLHDTEFDGNTDETKSRIETLEAGGINKQLAGFDIQAGGVFYLVLNDATEIGPYQLPIARTNPRGAWAPDTAYAPMDSFYINGATYDVLLAHVSADTFDPGANDGSGHDFYARTNDNPANALPTGGPEGYELEKASADDYDVVWAQKLLSRHDDVAIATGVENGEHLVYRDGFWVNEPISLPPPTSGTDATLGGVFAGTAADDEFVTGIDEDGNLTFASAQSRLAELKSQDVSSAGGTLTIDLLDGQHVHVSVTEDIDTIVVNNWPAADTDGRAIITFTQAASFTVSGYPAGTVAIGGAPDMPTGADAIMRVALSSDDHGSTIFLDVIGNGYEPL